jgi:hypothetical protein
MLERTNFVKPTMLIVDQAENVVDEIRGVLEFDYEVLTASGHIGVVSRQRESG